MRQNEIYGNFNDIVLICANIFENEKLIDVGNYISDPFQIL